MAARFPTARCPYPSISPWAPCPYCPYPTGSIPISATFLVGQIARPTRAPGSLYSSSLIFFPSEFQPLPGTTNHNVFFRAGRPCPVLRLFFFLPHRGPLVFFSRADPSGWKVLCLGPSRLFSGSPSLTLPKVLLLSPSLSLSYFFFAGCRLRNNWEGFQ